LAIRTPSIKVCQKPNKSMNPISRENVYLLFEIYLQAIILRPKWFPGASAAQLFILEWIVERLASEWKLSSTWFKTFCNCHG